MTPTRRLTTLLAIALLFGAASLPNTTHAQSTGGSFGDVMDALDDAFRGNGNPGRGNGNGQGNGNGNRGQEEEPRREEPATPEQPATPAPTQPDEPEEPAPEPEPTPEPDPAPVEDEEPAVPLTPATINRPVVPPALRTIDNDALVASAGTIEAAQAAIFPYARTGRSPLAPEVLALLIAGAAALVRGFSLVRRETRQTFASA